MNFLNQIGKALKRPVFNGAGGRGGYGYFSRFNATYDFRSEAGALWESSIPLACLKWEQRASVEAEICVQARDEAGKWQIDSAHPALDVLANPNPFFDMTQLLDALRFDYHISGNAYLYKQRARSRKVVQLWWIPANHSGVLIKPRWDEGGGEFISCYEYQVNGVSYALPVEDVIHFRNGIDPCSGGREGLSDFAAVLREVCTDNEAGVIAAALCRNMGIPGVIISPKGEGAELTKTQRNSIKEIWKETFRGEGAGDPFVQSIPVEVTMPGFSLEQMCFDKLRSIPETRIAAAFGIPPSVLGLAAGITNSKTKGGRNDEREQAYESCVLPTLYTLARALTRSYMAEIADVKQFRVWFDLSEVRVLQTDRAEQYAYLSTAYDSGWLKRSDAREAAGYKAEKDDEVYKSATEPAKQLAAGSGQLAGDGKTTMEQNDQIAEAA